MTSNLTYDTLNSLELWQRMQSITLDQMRDVKLMNRIDTKYILSYDEVLQLLEAAAANNYFVQIIDGVRACRYETLYYDTSDREMFVVHHNRKLTRQKLRTRTYVESGISFFEIKNKSNRGRTKIGVVWMAFLLFFGTLVTHDYSLGKNFVTILGTIVAMAIIMFVIILFASLMVKMVMFISTLVSEIGNRI